jgi:hypothetical protein
MTEITQFNFGSASNRQDYAPSNHGSAIMLDEISDDLWALLRTLLPELVDEDRGRTNKS